MGDSVLDFYDQLSESYHLIGKDWTESVKWQADKLDLVIQKLTQRKASELRLYDCSCGIGTQAIGLALRGYSVFATDLSPKAIEKARKNAKDLGATIQYGIADFRDLQKSVTETFDVVISCDNSLPHLMTQTDLESAARSIYLALKPGGIFLASIRDYDQIKFERPSGMPPRKFHDSNSERVYFQTWDWADDGATYELELFVLQNKGEGWLPPISFRTHYRAVQRAEMDIAFSKAGFENIGWLKGEANPYYQPVMTARKP